MATGKDKSGQNILVYDLFSAARVCYHRFDEADACVDIYVHV